MKATIKVRMNRTAKGAPDSTTERTYLEGKEYDIPEDLAECFFSTGDADPAEAHSDGAPDIPAGSQPDAQVEPPSAAGSAPADVPVAKKKRSKG